MPFTEVPRSTGIIFFVGNALQNVIVVISRNGHLSSPIGAPLFFTAFSLMPS
jgi:hypothetical protein